MALRSRNQVFQTILDRPNLGLMTLHEAAGQIVFAIDDPSEVDDALQLASTEMRIAIRQFVDRATKTDAEWKKETFLVLDGDEHDIDRYRARVRRAVDAFRKQLGLD
jgi:hypothetical protein